MGKNSVPTMAQGYNTFMGGDYLGGMGDMGKGLLNGLTSPLYGGSNYMDAFNKNNPGYSYGADTLLDKSMMGANQMDLMNQGPSLMNVASTGMNMYNMYNSWQNQDKYMGMMNQQLAMATEQWDMTKQEVARIAQVRKNLNSSYA